MTVVSSLADGSADDTPDGDRRQGEVEETAESAGSAESEEGVPAEAPEEHVPVLAEPEVRRHPSTIGGAFYLVILAATVLGLVIVSTGRWRTGVHWMAGAMGAAAVLRAVLPARDAGMLAVRNRWFDAALLGGTGIALWVLATSVPEA